MIRKIQGNEYLKRYDNMTAQEREEYEGRVGQWLSDNSHMLAQKGEVFEARMQNVLQVSGTWNDQECQAFEEGARLLSALVNQADTWLPDMLYVKSAKRAIKQMVEALWDVDSQSIPTVEIIPKSPEVLSMNSKTITAEKILSLQERYAGNGDITDGHQQGEGENKEEVRSKKEEGRTQTSSIEHQPSSIIPARPKHIDQYVHLLPQKTQEHAALVQGLYRELEDARQKMQLLMDDKRASAADREAWAKKATKCDNTLRKIFDELDSEWEKLVKSGRVVVDDLGNARVMDDVRGKMDDGRGKMDDGRGKMDDVRGKMDDVRGKMDDGRGKMDDDSAISHQPSAITSEQKARRRELRKWLTDTRRGNGAGRDERVKQWKVNFKEYLTLEGDKAFEDEKILEAAKHYEIDLKDLK